MCYWTLLKTEISSSQRVSGMRGGPACCPVKQVQSSVKHIFNEIWLIDGWFEKYPDMESGADIPSLEMSSQVVGSDDTIGLFVLSTSLPGLPPSHCLDSCVYNKVVFVSTSLLFIIVSLRVCAGWGRSSLQILFLQKLNRFCELS